MKFWFALVNALVASTAMAQPRIDAAPEVLGRDIVAPSPSKEARPAPLPVIVRQDLIEEGMVNAPEAGVFVGAVNITGSRFIPADQLMPEVEPYLGKAATAEDLRAMVRAISQRARAMGYVFASAEIPQQQAELGVITVRLDDGGVDEVRIAGTKNRKVRAALATIRGEAVQKDVLERALLLAGDVPGITVVKTRYLRERDRRVLNVEIRDDRARGIAAVDSAGSKAFGPVRARLEFELAGLLDDGDVLTVQAVATPVSPRELAFAHARYAILLGNSGTRLSVAGAIGRTQVPVPGTDFEIDGRSHYASVGLSHPVLRSNRASVWLSAEAAYLNVEQSVFGAVLQRDDIVTFALGANGDFRVAGGRLSGGLTATQGLNALGANGSGDLLSSRFDGSGSFTKGNVWLNWFGPVSNTLSLRVAGQGQLASRPLLAAQEMGLGGPGYGRAYDFSERFGDQGVAGLIELRRNFSRPTSWIDWAHIYAFADGGYVDNLEAGAGSGALFSTGFGLRGGKGPFDLAVEAAFPINKWRNASGNKDPRLNVSAGVVF